MMQLSQEEFDTRFREALDLMIAQMAEKPEIDLKQFGGLTLFLENLTYFSPVLWSLLNKTDET